MVTQNPQANGESQFNEIPYYSPRIWHGMSVRTWYELAKEHQFKFDRPDFAFWVTYFSFWSSFGNRLGALLHKRKAAKLPLVDDPLFIIGHWRTGTTLLHTLLSKDDRYATPNCYQVFTPRHFIVSQPWTTRVIRFPKRRPMDNMELAWTEPQEDELAICVQGLPSVFRNSAFPRHERRYLESLDIEACSPNLVAKYRQVIFDFVKMLNLKYRRPIVLKSPPNTGRIRMLLELFPNAKFIHLTRNPFEFVPSTMHLWRAMDKTNGFQARDENLTEQEEADYVFDCFHAMYGAFDRQKSALPARNYCEIRFDELTSRPLETLRGIYEQLRLGDFEHVAPKIDEHMQSKKDYQRNKHELPADLEARISQQCGAYFDQYDYAPTQPSSVKAA